jgi:hypothetical protein
MVIGEAHWALEWQSRYRMPFESLFSGVRECHLQCALPQRPAELRDVGQRNTQDMRAYHPPSSLPSLLLPRIQPQIPC